MRFHSNIISFFIPDFIEMQRSSFIYLLLDRFVKDFSNRKHIRIRKRRLKLFFYPEYYQLSYPEESPSEAVLKGNTYCSRLYVPVQLVNWQTKEVEIKWVLLGSLPLMTKRGHFIINGCPTVVVNQLVRSPGIYYNERYTKIKKIRIVWGDLIPQRGAWLRLTTDKEGGIYARLKKGIKISMPFFLRAFGVSDNEIKAWSPRLWYYTTSTRESAFTDLCRDVMSSIKRTRRKNEVLWGTKFLRRRFKNRRTYNLSEAGRLILNNKFGVSVRMDRLTLTHDDILSAISLLYRVIFKQRKIDDIDSLENRRVRTSGELIANQINVGLSGLSKKIRTKMVGPNRGREPLKKPMHIQSLITTKHINGSLREFFGLNPLSQYMDQTNPLAEITHKRRVTSLGPGGINRESAIQVRSIHPTYFGRICPIETPEGKNAGLVSSITIYSKISSQGFLRTPFHKTYKGQVQSKRGVSLFCVNQEKGLNLAAGDLQLSKLGFLPAKNVPVKVDKEYQSIVSGQADYSAVSPLQMLSVATSLIPFLEHNDANRALMGSNMQRQAVPLVSTEVPVVGTGLEPRAAANSLVLSKTSGYVVYASSEKISVQPFKSKSNPYSPCLLSKASNHYHAKHRAESHTRVRSFASNPQRGSVWGAIKNNTATEQKYERFYKAGFVFAERVNLMLEPGSAKPAPLLSVSLTQSKAFPCKPAKESFDDQQANLLQGGTQVVNYLQRASFKKLPVVTPKTFLLRANSLCAPVGSKHKIGQRFQQSVLTRFAFGLTNSSAMFGKSFKPQTPTGLGLGLACITQDQGQDQDQASDANYYLPERMAYKSSVPTIEGKVKRKQVRKTKNWGTTVTRHGANELFGDKEQITLTGRCVTGERETSLLDLRLLPAGPIQGGCLVPTRGCAFNGSNNLLSCGNDHRNLTETPQGGSTALLNSWFNLVEYELQVFQRSNQGTCLSQKPAVNEGDWVQKGDLLADSSSTHSGELALGRNLLLAYMPWEGYNFEDAILINERLLYDNLFTSIHIERYRVEFRRIDSLPRRNYVKSLDYLPGRFHWERVDLIFLSRWFKPKAKKSDHSNFRKLDRDGVVKIGSWVVGGDVLLRKRRVIEKKYLTPYEKMLYKFCNWVPPVKIRVTKLEVPKAVEGRVVRVEICKPAPFWLDDNKPRPSKTPNRNYPNRYRSQSQGVEMYHWQGVQNGHNIRGQGTPVKVEESFVRESFPSPARRIRFLPLSFKRLLKERRARGAALQELGRSVLRSRVAIANPVSLYVLAGVYKMIPLEFPLRRGLDPYSRGRNGEPFRIDIYLAESREMKVGDKMSGRHGNKGIVSKILPRQDMPYLPNGLPVDVVLNPLGVPSRMNVGQVFESLLGLAGVHLNQQFKILPFDELYGPESSRTLVYSKLYQARLKTGQSWLFNPETPGKMPLFDGRTGQLFEQSVTVGRGYMLKLIHLVDHKVHARLTGRYALITQQPVKGKSNNGGQRVGEMEVWALEGFGAAHTLHELLTVKSDDVKGRNQVMDSILNQKPLKLDRPAAFKVLIRELQSLCLRVEFFQLRRTNPYITNPYIIYQCKMARAYMNRLERKMREASRGSASRDRR